MAYPSKYIVINNTEDDGNYCIAEFAGLINDIYMYQLCYHLPPMTLTESTDKIQELINNGLSKS